jgi:hypothetical protein
MAFVDRAPRLASRLASRAAIEILMAVHSAGHTFVMECAPELRRRNQASVI